VTADFYPHHITQRGNNHADVFFDDVDRGYYLKKLKECCEDCRVRIWAYCLMTNHVRLLAVPEDSHALSRCIGRTNLSYTQYVNRRYNRSGRLWQNRFFSTIVEKDSYLWAVTRYIELNPIKAKLVKDPLAYPWSSCGANTGGRQEDFVKSEDWLDEKDRNAYRRFLMRQDANTDETIRISTSTGRPLGSREFIEKLEAKLSRNLFPKKAGRPRKEETRMASPADKSPNLF